MQVVILCGGKGTRMGYMTEDLPKPLIPIGKEPIVLHIMKHFSKHGFTNFLLLTGYKHEKVVEYFEKCKDAKKWSIEYSVCDSTKGDSIRQAYNEGKITGNFILSYGDDLCDVDINKLVQFHHNGNCIATITSVNLVSDFGIIETHENSNIVSKFREKPKLEEHWINGGYIVFDESFKDYIMEGGDETDVFEKLVKEKKVQIYRHSGFWKSMNTLKDLEELHELIEILKKRTVITNEHHKKQ